MSEETYQEHQAELHNAILAVSGAAMVTHYVVVAAVIEKDTEETNHIIVSPGLPLWQAKGLLEYEAAGLVPQPVWTLAQNKDDEEGEDD